MKDQSTGSQNGIYIYNSSGAWSRSSDFDDNVEVTSGAFTFVEQGDTNADKGFALTTDGSITVGTTSLTFSQFSGAGQITTGTGLDKSGNQINLKIQDLSEVTPTNGDKLVTLDSDGSGRQLTSLSSLATLFAGSSLTATNTTIDVQDNFLRNDGNDTTSGTITAAGFTTTGTWTFDSSANDGSTVGVVSIQPSTASFGDSNVRLMTASAIQDKIDSYAGTGLILMEINLILIVQ